VVGVDAVVHTAVSRNIGGLVSAQGVVGEGDVRAVYRVNTAGGNPPTTCESRDAVFSVQYATEY
jgi:hypothetical protein